MHTAMANALPARVEEVDFVGRHIATIAFVWVVMDDRAVGSRRRDCRKRR